MQYAPQPSARHIKLLLQAPTVQCVQRRKHRRQCLPDCAVSLKDTEKGVGLLTKKRAK